MFCLCYYLKRPWLERTYYYGCLGNWTLGQCLLLSVYTYTHRLLLLPTSVSNAAFCSGQWLKQWPITSHNRWLSQKRGHLYHSSTCHLSAQGVCKEGTERAGGSEEYYKCHLGMSGPLHSGTHGSCGHPEFLLKLRLELSALPCGREWEITLTWGYWRLIVTGRGRRFHDLYNLCKVVYASGNEPWPMPTTGKMRK